MGYWNSIVNTEIKQYNYSFTSEFVITRVYCCILLGCSRVGARSEPRSLFSHKFRATYGKLFATKKMFYILILMNLCREDFFKVKRISGRIASSLHSALSLEKVWSDGTAKFIRHSFEDTELLKLVLFGRLDVLYPRKKLIPSHLNSFCTSTQKLIDVLSYLNLADVTQVKEVSNIAIQ